MLFRLSKIDQNKEVGKMNKRIGKERRSCYKKRRFVDCVEPDYSEANHEEDFVEEVDHDESCYQYNVIPREVQATVAHGSVPPDHMTIRQIFELWNISNVMSDGVGGDGWNIGLRVCQALTANGYRLLQKVGTPAVRVYDMSDPKVVSIIGGIITRYLADRQITYCLK
jgi:hypothetical protein